MSPDDKCIAPSHENALAQLKVESGRRGAAGPTLPSPPLDRKGGGRKQRNLVELSFPCALRASAGDCFSSALFAPSCLRAFARDCSWLLILLAFLASLREMPWLLLIEHRRSGVQGLGLE